MTRRKFLTCFLWATCSLFLFCCSNPPKHQGPGSNSESGGPGGDIKYQFGIHLAKGERFYYTIKTEVQTRLEVNDKKTELTNESEFGLIYDIISDSGGIYMLRITYDKLHMVIKKTDEEDQVLNADNAANSGDRMENLLSNIKGSSLFITLNVKGDILKATGSKEISDKILAPMAMETLDTKKKVQDFISKLTGESFVANNLKNGFKIFPDSGLYVGDTWSKTSSQSGDINFTVNEKYTLQSIEDNVAELSVEGQIDNPKNGITDFMGYNVTTDLKGEQEGKSKVDIKSGLLQYGKTSITIKGEIGLMGKTVPVRVKIKKEIAARKLKEY